MTKQILGFVLSSMLLALGGSAEAQQPGKVSRLGYLSSGDATTESTRSEGIQLALRELGYIEGQITVEYRYSESEGRSGPRARSRVGRS
jgi:hypothetical protein